MITRFNDFRIPDVNSVSKDFWKMVTVTNWKSVIKVKKNYLLPNNERDMSMKKAKGRLYTKYTFEEMHNFDNEYYIIYEQLYNWFMPITQDNRFKFSLTDDGYSDLLSSIIGKGKKFVKECILDTKLFVEMAKNRDYVENFEYLLRPEREEYIRIKEEFDPLFKDMNKYNL